MSEWAIRKDPSKLDRAMKTARRLFYGESDPQGKSVFDSEYIPMKGAPAKYEGVGMDLAMPLATAYHGSPHKFSKFDMSKIGTGEGAQAYGHGLYAAENPKVAKEYLNPDANYKRAYGHLNNRQEFIKDMMDQGREKDDVWKMTQEKYGEWVDPKDLSLDFKSIWSDGPGNLYKVDIPDDQIAKMLDWDKPLSEQPQLLQDMARKSDLTRMKEGNRTRRMIEKWRDGTEQADYPATGHTFYNSLTDYGQESAPELSQKLYEAGIPGIKYLDQGSRGPVKAHQTLSCSMIKPQRYWK
jgi:hypothetical protein